jgi:hypothetical protein
MDRIKFPDAPSTQRQRDFAKSMGVDVSKLSRGDAATLIDNALLQKGDSLSRFDRKIVSIESELSVARTQLGDLIRQGLAVGLWVIIGPKSKLARCQVVEIQKGDVCVYFKDASEKKYFKNRLTLGTIAIPGTELYLEYDPILKKKEEEAEIKAQKIRRINAAKAWDLEVKKRRMADAMSRGVVVGAMVSTPRGDTLVKYFNEKREGVVCRIGSNNFLFRYEDVNPVTKKK